MTTDSATPVPSAAAVRAAAAGFEVLLVRRNAQLAFHGGAWVFPGGRIDAHELAAHPEEAQAALRRPGGDYVLG